ncbi:MAG TPA: chorismate mutase [Sphingopyxis sp.]|nr:chorismate mutase [Sphingopyxis sp.]HMP45992.1 chorismate mutase [Sphingopyxis sp.]HMQ17693.1 chorismate mutase [Sphingopyxis sp.]
MSAPKSPEPKSPEHCETMADVRAGVDRVDRELVALLVRRFGYMDAAARIKTERGAVRDEVRKAQVLDNVAREAEAAGLDPDRLRAVWDVLVEQSIAYEFAEWDRRRPA